MATVEVERTIAAPVERVFDLLTDHANYKQFPGLTASELLREGTEDRNGVGAMRRVSSGPVHFEEEITAFERPSRMDYVIRRVNLPIDHEGGTIRCEPRDGGTHVVWRSTFTGTTPGVGKAFAAASAPPIHASFARILRYVDRELSD